MAFQKYLKVAKQTKPTGILEINEELLCSINLEPKLMSIKTIRMQDQERSKVTYWFPDIPLPLNL